MKKMMMVVEIFPPPLRAARTMVGNPPLLPLMKVGSPKVAGNPPLQRATNPLMLGNPTLICGKKILRFSKMTINQKGNQSF